MLRRQFAKFICSVPLLGFEFKNTGDFDSLYQELGFFGDIEECGGILFPTQQSRRSFYEREKFWSVANKCYYVVKHVSKSTLIVKV